MRNDPSDTGGLFLGPRPGLSRVHYDELPDVRSEGRRWMLDRALGHVVLAVLVLGCIALWAPLPLAAMWIASHVTQNGTLWVLVALVLTCVFVFYGLGLLRRVDRAWLLLRRASGLDQQQGALNRVFAAAACIAFPIGVYWFFFIGGIQPMIAR